MAVALHQYAQRPVHAQVQTARFLAGNCIIKQHSRLLKSLRKGQQLYFAAIERYDWVICRKGFRRCIDYRSTLLFPKELHEARIWISPAQAHCHNLIVHSAGDADFSVQISQQVESV